MIRIAFRAAVLSILSTAFLATAACGGGGGSGGSPEVMLAQFNNTSAGGTAIAANFVDFRLSGGLFGGSHETPIAPFVGTSAVGHVLTASPTHPAYDDLVATLTDGEAGQVGLRIRPGGMGGAGYVANEDHFFGTGDVGTLMPDAAGYAITRIEIEINQLTLVSPGNDPNGDGQWTDYTYDVTVRVFGQAAN
ncbi:MAG: hypothetical protein QNJ98_09835 [Planctomycetota bacterium]|nr:hypothetical protein [Planctomycetota bacterium]